MTGSRSIGKIGVMSNVEYIGRAYSVTSGQGAAASARSPSEDGPARPLARPSPVQ